MPGPARPRNIGRIVAAILLLAVVATIGSCFLGRQAYRPSSVQHGVALSADGQRLAVRTWRADTGTSLLEGEPGAVLHVLQPPPGQRFEGTMAYAALGRTLLFGTRGAQDLQGMGRTVLWKQDRPAPPERVLEEPLGIGKVFALRGGGYVLQAGLGETARTGELLNVNPRAASTWREYGWKVVQADGATRLLPVRESPYAGVDSLVRDEVLLMVEQVRDPPGPVKDGYQYTLRTVPIGAAAGPSMPPDLLRRAA